MSDYVFSNYQLISREKFENTEFLSFSLKNELENMVITPK